ncbi:hypothetical protein D3C72_1739080 [compost metagenome]
MLVSHGFGMINLQINAQFSIGVGVHIIDNLLPAIVGIFRIDKADGANGAGINQWVLRTLWTQFDGKAGIKG